MSRIGRLPIRVPNGVSVDVSGTEIKIKGPKGALVHPLVDHISVTADKGEIRFDRDGDDKVARANHGLMRAVVNNMVRGVSTGWEKALQIEGTGFRAEVKGRNLVLTLGFSHPIEYSIPTGIDIVVDKQTRVVVKGTDRQQVGQVAANIRAFRKPDSYKGKGIRYEGEVLRLKEGKSA
jgi:large subunit ribosomal protein L6